MAQPTSIFTSPSTTIVQVDSNTIQSPYTPVLLNTVAFPGQVVTVFNTLSSLTILQEPIVVSTVSGTVFSDTSISTLIQQPQGFVTAQTQGSNQWSYLNSYPFRDQYISAGVQNLTTSSLYTALNSTIQDRTSSLQVENLVVKGNFYQSSGLTLNTSVSTLGFVYLLSSLTVKGAAYFSSSVSSFGYTSFGSTVSVVGNFYSRSSLQFESTLTISTSLSVLQDISMSGTTRQVRLDGGLIGTTLEVQTSSPVAMNVAGSLRVETLFSTLSSFYVGGDVILKDVVLWGSLSSLSSAAIHENLFVDTQTLVKQTVQAGGPLGIAHDLSIGESFTLYSTLQTFSNLIVKDMLLSLSSLSTNSMAIESAYIQGNLTVSSSVVSTQNLFLNGSVGFQDMISISTSIGGSASTLSDLVVSNGTYLQGYLFPQGTLSTLSSFSTLQDVYALGDLSVGTSLFVSGGMTVYGNQTTLETLALNTHDSPFVSSVISKDLSIYTSISITDTAILSSIVLPSSVLAFQFITSTFQTGYQGIASSVLISTLHTSSLTTGGLLNANASMDMANVYQTLNLSTFQLSTLLFQVGATSQPSTSIQFTSSLGVLQEATLNTITINTVAYTLSNTYVEKTLSSLELYASNIEGSFYGDGFLLSNVNYPAKISTLFLSTGTLVVEKAFVSSLYASSGVVVDVFAPYSTLRIGDFTVYGNATQDILQASNTLRTVRGSPNALLLNNLYCYGDAASLYQKQVVVNSNIIPSLSNLYTFGVGGVLHLNNIVSPEFVLYIQSFYGDTVVGVNIGSFDMNTLYVSSGSIGTNNGVFFLPEGTVPLVYSTNTVQPVLSTLVFNSTLIVDREKQAVGIHTQPFYTLDVAPETFVQQGLLVSQSTLIQNKLNILQQQSSFWLAVTSNDGASNIQYSADEGMTWSPFTPTNFAQGGTLLNIATNGGQLTLTQSNTLVSENLWIATGVPVSYAYREGESSWRRITNTSKLPQSNAAVAYNGRRWVLTGYNTSNFSPLTFPPLHWSDDGLHWTAAVSGGYTWDSVSSNYGGYAVAWNGSYWITVGQGASPVNSILYSGDGKNWSNSVSGGFAYGGSGVVWTGTNWVATGNNGGPLSSFCVSADGSNWIGIGGYGFNRASGYQRGNAIATDGSIVVAVGTYFSAWPSASIQYSLDKGFTWQNATGSLFNSDTDEGLSIAYNGSYWLAGGTSGVRKSFDGISWFLPPGSPSPLTFQGLAYSSNAQPVLQIGESNYISSYTSTITTMNVACGSDGSNCVRYSADGITWSNALSGFFTTNGRGVAYNGSNLWVAAGSGLASNYIYSQDGMNWSNGAILSVLSLFAIGTSVAYGSGYWIATMDPQGFGDTLFYSSNGTTWDAASGGTQFTGVGYGTTHGNGKYMAVGNGGNTILYAETLTPPSRWTATGIINAFDTTGYGIAYGNGLWIAVGEDTTGKSIKSSSNQTNWIDGTGIFGTAGYGLDYNGSNLWIAVGNGAPTYGVPTSNILYSGDGSNWSNVTSGDFITSGYGVRYNQGLRLWIATGYDLVGCNTVKYSGNGLNWSNGSGGFDQIGYGVGVASNTFITETSYINQLRFYNTPGPAVTTRNTTPNISYTSTSITYMDTMTIDRFKTVSIHECPSGYISSFYDNGLAVVSSFVSTNATQVAGYFLTAALV